MNWQHAHTDPGTESTEDKVHKQVQKRIRKSPVYVEMSILLHCQLLQGPHAFSDRMFEPLPCHVCVDYSESTDDH